MRGCANPPTFARADEANEAFTRLMKTAPASAFLPDAYLLIGEYSFDRIDAYKALVAYQRAADAVRRLAVLRPDAHPLLAETLLAPRYVVDGSALAAFEGR